MAEPTNAELAARVAELEAEIAALLLAGDPNERQRLLDALAEANGKLETWAREYAGQVAAEVAALQVQLAEVSPAAAELERLTAFLLEHGAWNVDESTVDLAIRLLQPTDPAETLAPSVLVRAALAAHLAEFGCREPEDAANTLAQIIDFARGTSRLPEPAVRALMALAE